MIQEKQEHSGDNLKAKVRSKACLSFTFICVTPVSVGTIDNNSDETPSHEVKQDEFLSIH